MGLLQGLLGRAKSPEGKTGDPAPSRRKVGAYALWLNESLINLDAALQDLFKALMLVIPGPQDEKHRLSDDERNRLLNVIDRFLALEKEAAEYTPSGELLWPGYSHEVYVRLLARICDHLVPLLAGISASDRIRTIHAQIGLANCAASAEALAEKLAKHIGAGSKAIPRGAVRQAAP